MEGIQKAFRSVVSQDSNLASISSSIEKAKTSFNNTLSSVSSTSSGSLPAEQSQLLLTRSSRRVVSLWTCSKIGAFCFVAGIIVGYTLKRRVRRWASRLLKRIKDD